MTGDEECDGMRCANESRLLLLLLFLLIVMKKSKTKTKNGEEKVVRTKELLMLPN